MVLNQDQETPKAKKVENKKSKYEEIERKWWSIY